jgi:hypothetical protein
MRKKANEAFEYVLSQAPNLIGVFDSLTFGDKKKYKPLQAADALAYDLNKDFTAHLNNPNAPTRKLLDAILQRVPRRGVYWPWEEKTLRPWFKSRYKRLTKAHSD